MPRNKVNSYARVIFTESDTRWQTNSSHQMETVSGIISSQLIPHIKLSYEKGTPATHKSVRSSADAHEILWPCLKDTHDIHESFWMILLNRANDVKALAEISRGGVHGTVADPKLIFSIALASLSPGIIVAHNHPSGQRKPSEADKRLTKKLTEAGKLLDIAVLDHIIVCGPNSYYSFADEIGM